LRTRVADLLDLGIEPQVRVAALERPDREAWTCSSSPEREILDAEPDHWQPRVAVHFGAKLLQWAMFDFGQGIPRVLVVLNPNARKRTLRALDMRATVDREEFFAFQHGEGRLKLIERLAAAYRAGELPDYLLEFVDSLKTRAKRPTS
jgi:hypothetical protein